MLRKMTMLLFAILVNYATAVIAGDYVLDASTMGVGATAGENLVVKEGCLDPSKTSCTEKYKWLTATSAIKIGNLQVLGELKGNFEITVTLDAGSDPKSIKLLTSDNKGLVMTLDGEFGDYSFSPNGGIGEGGYKTAGFDGWPDTLPGWQSGNAFNEIKITVQGGAAQVYTNGSPLGDSVSLGGRITLENPDQLFNRVSFEGITANDRIADIKVRGIQGSTTCGSTPTTPSTSTSSGGDCTADYGANGSLHVPCVRVPGAFGKMELYDVWMQQRFPAYAFDLDLNRVTPK